MAGSYEYDILLRQESKCKSAITSEKTPNANPEPSHFCEAYFEIIWHRGSLHLPLGTSVSLSSPFFRFSRHLRYLHISQVNFLEV
jgi:hypothetical protein